MASSNLESFRLNVLLESTRLKMYKKATYMSILAIYAGMNLAMGSGFQCSVLRTAAFVVAVLILFGTSFGQTVVSFFSSLIPWTKFGYYQLRIVGSEIFAEETPVNLFLHKQSRVGEISEWLALKTGAPGGVTLVWAGSVVKEDASLSSVGIENGCSLIAVLNQAKLDAPLQLGQQVSNRIRFPVAPPTDPDFSYDGEDLEIPPKFIHEMFDDSDDSDGEEEKDVPVPIPAGPSVWTKIADQLSAAAVQCSHVLANLSYNFKDTKYCHADVLVMPAAPVAVAQSPPPLVDDSDDSDTDDPEAPSFLREMLSDDEDSDDDEPAVQVKPPKPWGTILRKQLRILANKVRVKVLNKLPSLPQLSNRVVEPTWITKTSVRDMVTLDEDDGVRYMMPCRIPTHAMSQESLFQYIKNKIMVEKVYKLTCPGDCGKDWDFAEVRELLQQTEDPEFKFQADEFRTLEENLSANFVSQSMNCQRCPECEIAIGRDADTEEVECKCFGCNTTFCWACRAPWVQGSVNCLNPKCLTAWRFTAAQMLKSCPRKQLDHMENVPTMRACPTCGQMITHVTACKHMRCSLCKTRFCFICMKPQANGAWQCGYDRNSCKLTEVQSVNALADGKLSRSNLLERISPEIFRSYKHMDEDEFRAAREEFVNDVMTSIKSATFFN